MCFLFLFCVDASEIYHIIKLKKIFVYPVHLRDNIPTVVLQSWNLAADMFDGVDTAGPVPFLASQNEDSTREGLNRFVQRVW